MNNAIKNWFCQLKQIFVYSSDFYCYWLECLALEIGKVASFPDNSFELECYLVVGFSDLTYHVGGTNHGNVF